MACPRVFPVCPGEILLTLRPKISRHTILTGCDQVRSGMFTTVQFPFKYGQCVSTAYCEVVFGYLTVTGKCFHPKQ